MIYHRRCTGCGSDIRANNAGGVIYCEWCKEVARQERRERRILNSHRRDEYKVINDPTPVELGGFVKGARITQKELVMGLRPEFRSFTVGTIIESKGGVKFLVLDVRNSNGLRLQKI